MCVRFIVGDNQRFRFDKVGADNVAIICKDGGKCISVNGASSDNGVGIEVWPYHEANSNQMFKLTESDIP